MPKATDKAISADDRRGGRAKGALFLPRSPIVMIILAAMLLSTAARSEEPPDPGAPRTLGPWTVTLGLGAAVAPKYEGSKHAHVEPLPLASVTYRDLLSVGPGGARLSVLHASGFEAGPALGMFGGRSHKDDAQLNHVGGLATAVSGGGFVRYHVNRLSFEADLAQALSLSDRGLRGRVAASWRQPIVGDRLWADAGPALVFADDRYERAYFGITPTQSQRSGLRAFRPEGGLESAGLDTSLSWKQSEHVLVRAMANVHRLTGDAADSPLVQSKTQLVVGLGAAYRF